MWSKNTFSPFGMWEKSHQSQRIVIFWLAYVYSIALLYWQENWGSMRLGNLPKAIQGSLNSNPLLPDSGTCTLAWYHSWIWTSCSISFCYLFCPGHMTCFLWGCPLRLLRRFLAFAALSRAELGWEFLNVVLRVNDLYREFTLDFSSLPHSIQSRDKLVMTAGFHSLGADREIMSQIGLGYEMKPWKGIIIRLLSGESRERDLN